MCVTSIGQRSEGLGAVENLARNCKKTKEKKNLLCYFLYYSIDELKSPVPPTIRVARTPEILKLLALIFHDKKK